MLNDAISMGIAIYAIKLSKKSADQKYSYGWHRAEVIAALVNGVFLLALCFSIFMESLERFARPPEIEDPRLIVIGTLFRQLAMMEPQFYASCRS
ncbi:hypothetical protein FRB91_005217 [Serendipita sp. 411]|nr:hypothetical protein FRC15_002249 [Serendipita sp. 397]KAG8841237.1 hypothetical protein FRB91_005217 [Serendipita sp. 411]